MYVYVYVSVGTCTDLCSRFVCVYECMLLRLYVGLLVLRRDESLCVLAAQRCHGLAPDRRMPRAQRCCRARCDLHPRY